MPQSAARFSGSLGAAEAIEPVWKNGLRYTDERTVRIVEQTLNGDINLGICENIQTRKGRPIGIKGQEIFRCKKLETDREGNPVDLGFVGVQVEKNRELRLRAGALGECGEVFQDHVSAKRQRQGDADRDDIQRERERRMAEPSQGICGALRVMAKPGGHETSRPWSSASVREA